MSNDKAEATYGAVEEYSRLDRLDGLDSRKPNIRHGLVQEPPTQADLYGAGYRFGSVHPPRQRLRPAVKMLLAFALGAACAAAAFFFGAATAKADTLTDTAFLNVLVERGINADADGGGQQLINAGHEVCTHLDNGMSVLRVIDYVDGKTQLATDDAAYFVGVSIAAYCPEYTDAAYMI